MLLTVHLTLMLYRQAHLLFFCSCLLVCLVILFTPRVQAQRETPPLFSPSEGILVCGETCEVDSDCQSGFCSQFVCPLGQNCPDVYSGKQCRNRACPSSSTCNCVTPTPVVVATPTPVPSPTLLGCNVNCSSNDQCQTGYCYQPPMPTCPPGLNCPQVMPAKVCRNETNPTSTTCQAGSPTPVPTTNPDEETICRADLNQDGIVDLSDYSFMLADFFETVGNGASARNDFNGDGLIDISDYGMYYPLLTENFFERCNSWLSFPTM